MLNRLQEVQSARDVKAGATTTEKTPLLGGGGEVKIDVHPEENKKNKFDFNVDYQDDIDAAREAVRKLKETVEKSISKRINKIERQKSLSFDAKGTEKREKKLNQKIVEFTVKVI